MAVLEQTLGHPSFGLTWELPVLRASAWSGSVPSLAPSGNGAPMGLSHRKHFHWASKQGHHAADISAQVNQEVRQAVHLELTHDIGNIDEERLAIARNKRKGLDFEASCPSGSPTRLWVLAL